MTRVPVAERRQRLIDAAARVIARDGLASATTRAITAEAEMPRGMFHYCFESKDALLAELIKQHVTDMLEAGRATWREDLGLRENLALGLRAFVEVGMANPSEEMISYELALHALRSPTPAAAAAQYRDYSNQATTYLEFAAKQAGVRWQLPTPTLARMLVTFIDGSMLHWLADRDTDACTSALEAFAGVMTDLAEPIGSQPDGSRRWRSDPAASSPQWP